MTINHEDAEVQAAFDAELIARRLGMTEHAGLIRHATDRDYIIGLLGASTRNATPEQKIMRKLARTMTDDMRTGHVELPDNTPRSIRDDAGQPLSVAVQSALLRRLTQRIEARALEAGEDLI